MDRQKKQKNYLDCSQSDLDCSQSDLDCSAIPSVPATTLTESQEKLLMVYIDGECSKYGFVFSPLVGFRARRLISRTKMAAEFVKCMRTTCDQAQAALLATQSSSVNLWEKVSDRIEQEERTALYLGERRTPREEGAWFIWNRLSWSKLSWGACGALTTAALVLFIVPYGITKQSNVSGIASQYQVSGIASSVSGIASQYQVSGIASNVSGIASQYQQVSGSALQYQQPQEDGIAKQSKEDSVVENVALSSSELLSQEQSPSLEDLVALRPPEQLLDVSAMNRNRGELSSTNRMARALEVDWMHSNGRVRVIQDPSEKAAIFWVRRNRSGFDNTDRASAFSQGQVPIHIIEPDGPTALNVRDR